MSEAVRLIIWDLDETFWNGTLTEGGITYQQDTHDLVINLSKRGIVSSICSKNDYAAVREVLVAHGIWDFFTFPSIDWTPKGARLTQIIKNFQLRPSSVMFIDDNPLNRNEALQFIPSLQVNDEKFIRCIAADPRFSGKDDPLLERLASYKLLERRNIDQVINQDNTDFLRKSGIRASVEFDVEANIDRAVELINRTNQLNFTKQRLPEIQGEGILALLKELKQPNVQAGLVRLSDNYGDYGLIGFYLLHVHTGRLVHYCFSCRTLGMGIETWVFNRLGRPNITIVGEVLTDLFAPAPPVDWINVDVGQGYERGDKLGRVFVRGSCEMQALAHYVGLDASEVVGEFGFERNGLPIAASHSVLLCMAIDGFELELLDAAASIGYKPSDFTSAIFGENSFNVVIYSFWADAHFALYRDPNSGVLLPFGVNEMNNGADLSRTEFTELATRIHDEDGKRFAKNLVGRYDYCAWSLGIDVGNGETLFQKNLRRIFAYTPRSCPIFVLLGCEYVPVEGCDRQSVVYLAELNRQTRLASEEFPHVHLIDPQDFFRNNNDIFNATHFERTVYFRIYLSILEQMKILRCPVD